MISWLAVLVGVIFAVIGIRKGFYPMWMMLFNILVSIYLGVMLSPLIVQIRPDMDHLRYYLAACVAVIAVMAFVILQVIKTSFLAEISESLCPRFFDNVIAGILGFLSGYVVFSFVFLAVCIMPFSKLSFMKGFCGDGISTPDGVKPIVKACNFVATTSMQCYSDTAVGVVDWLVAPDKESPYNPLIKEETDY
jgi:uncharacterized membrane protein required for colicin V production